MTVRTLKRGDGAVLEERVVIGFAIGVRHAHPGKPAPEIRIKGLCVAEPRRDPMGPVA